MAFATGSDVAARMGITFTDAQQYQAEVVIETVQELIAEALYQDAGWANALAQVPVTLKNICIEKAIAALANPRGLESETETLGAFSHTERFRTDPSAVMAGVFLTAADRAKARRAVFGLNVTSVRIPSVLEEYLEDALGS